MNTELKLNTDISSYTEEEILSMDDEFIEKLVKLKCLEEGYVPSKLEVLPIPTGNDIRSIGVAYNSSLINGILFADNSQLQSIHDMIEAANINGCNYEYVDGQRYYLTDRKPTYNIETVNIYNKEDLDNYRKIINTKQSIIDENKTLKNKHNQNLEQYNNILDSIWKPIEKVRAIKQIFDTRCNILENDYFPLVPNKEDAITLFLKAYSLTQEELYRIRQHYRLITENIS